MKELALALLCYALGLIVGAWMFTETDQRYDYKINLDYDKIEVYRVDEGDVVIVEPDSLDEFIIKDNL